MRPSTDYIQAEIDRSRKIFLSKIWPIWSADLGAAGIVSVEGSQHPLERSADRSGTDAFMVRHKTGILVPLASRIEFFDERWNNPYNPRYAEHYPRFTVSLAVRQDKDVFIDDVECRKRLAALDDPISRRYLPLYTFQSLVKIVHNDIEILQTSRVSTRALFDFVKEHNLGDRAVGKPSFTNKEGDCYRIITAEKLAKANISVTSFVF